MNWINVSPRKPQNIVNISSKTLSKPLIYRGETCADRSFRNQWKSRILMSMNALSKTALQCSHNNMKNANGTLPHFLLSRLVLPCSPPPMNSPQVLSPLRNCAVVRHIWKRIELRAPILLQMKVILLLLNFEITFFLILEMYNKCWTDAVQPTDWQILKIVAIFKQKGSTKLPINYRPIALLQAFY